MRKYMVMLLSVFFLATCGYMVKASDIIPEKNLAAQWTPNAVKIIFNSNGGGVAPNEQIYTYGIERSLPGKGKMSKAGYHFIGWAETSGASVPKWEAGETNAEAFGYADETKAIAKTLYAVWELDDTATASDIKKNLTAHINDEKISGSMDVYPNILEYINAGESYELEPGYYSGGSIQGNSLSSQTSGTANASNILSGYTAWVNGSKITGNISSKSAQTYTPSTSNQTISSGQYLSGVQTIKGDANLSSGNIRSGVSIFGVSGSYTGTISYAGKLLALTSFTSHNVPSGWNYYHMGNNDYLIYSSQYNAAICIFRGSGRISVPSGWNSYHMGNNNYLVYSNQYNAVICVDKSSTPPVPSGWNTYSLGNNQWLVYK